MTLRGSTWLFVLSLVLAGEIVGAERLMLTDDADAEEFFVAQPTPSATDQSAAAAADDSARSASRSSSSRSSARSSYARLARAPNMFGDSFGSGGQIAENATIVFVPRGGGQPVVCQCGMGDATDLPGVGGGVIKVAENNKPIPMDRAYFIYNGFQNALSVGRPAPTDVNFNRYTVGLEKTFHNGLWSVNVALPFNDDLSLNSDSYTVTSNSLGNLAIFLKNLSYSDEEFAVSTGLGFSVPTGSDLNVQSHQFNPVRAVIETETLIIRNDSLHLIPYLGLLSQPGEDWFSIAFFSLDLAANGNSVEVGSPPGEIGILTPQNLFHFDYTIGRWLIRSPESTYMTGVAVIGEVHYTKTIQNTDTVIIPTNPDTGTFINAQLTNLANQTDIVNLTTGLQFQIGEFSNLRVGYVVPVQEQPYRQFDSEAQVSFNRNF